MNIGVIVDNELNNDNRVLREISILKEQGNKIFVLCFGFHKVYATPINEIIITRIRIPRKLKDALFFILNTLPLYEWVWSSYIKRFIIRNNIEALHAHDLYMSKAAHEGISRSGGNIPMILDLHENYPFQVTAYNWTKGFLRNLLSRPSKWKKKEPEYLSYADRIVVLSNEYRDSLVNEYPQLTRNKFAVFPNVPDISAPEYTNKTKINNPFPDNFPILLYYGVIAERRGIFETLEVFTELVKNRIEVNLLLIGPVDKKDRKHFNELTSRVDLKGRMIHIPWISSRDFPGYLEISDICLAPFRKNPQHESGIANKIFDYMLGSKPIVASDCIPQQTLIEKHNCGLIFRNPTELKNCIIRLLEDPSLRITLGRNGYEAIIRNYNIEKVKEDLISLYRSLDSGTRD